MIFDPYILSFSLITVAATIWMGFRSARQSKTASDFFVAGRSVSVGWNASAISGEYLSAASFMGIAGMVMSSGYDALWYPVCYACGYLFLLLFIAGPLRRFGAYTIPDFAEGRFDSPLFRKIAVVFVLFIGFFYTMPQMKGAGTTLAYIFPGLPYWAGVVVVGAVITLNVALGGMKGITLVQAFQYWMKMFAISVPIFVLMTLYGHYGKQVGLNKETHLKPGVLYETVYTPFVMQKQMATQWVAGQRMSLVFEKPTTKIASPTPHWKLCLISWFGPDIAKRLQISPPSGFVSRVSINQLMAGYGRAVQKQTLAAIDYWQGFDNVSLGAKELYGTRFLSQVEQALRANGILLIEETDTQVKFASRKFITTGETQPLAFRPRNPVTFEPATNSIPLHNLLKIYGEITDRAAVLPTNALQEFPLATLTNFLSREAVEKYSSLAESGRSEMLKNFMTAIETELNRNGWRIEAVGSTAFLVAVMDTLRAPLPDKAPKDEAWLNPFGPLTTKAAKNAAAAIATRTSAASARDALASFAFTQATPVDLSPDKPLLKAVTDIVGVKGVWLPTPTNLVAVADLAGRCAGISSQRYWISSDLTNATVGFGHAAPLTNEQYVAAVHAAFTNVGAITYVRNPSGKPIILNGETVFATNPIAIVRQSRDVYLVPAARWTSALRKSQPAGTPPPIPLRAGLSPDQHLTVALDSPSVSEALSVYAELTGRHLLANTNSVAERMDDFLDGKLARLKLVSHPGPADSGVRYHNDGPYTAGEVKTLIENHLHTNGIALAPVGENAFRAEPIQSLPENWRSLSGPATSVPVSNRMSMSAVNGWVTIQSPSTLSRAEDRVAALFGKATHYALGNAKLVSVLMNYASLIGQPVIVSTNVGLTRLLGPLELDWNRRADTIPIIERFLAANGVALRPDGHASMRAMTVAQAAAWDRPAGAPADPQKAWLAKYEKPLALLYTYSLIIAIVCGTAGLPHILVRFYTNPNGVAAKKTTMWVMILIGTFYVFPPVFGVMGRNLMPSLYAGTGAKGTDKIVLELPRVVSSPSSSAADASLGHSRFPWGSILSGVTCAGAFAAFMSTFSGLLVSMTGALAHDVYGRMLRPNATPAQRMRMFRIAAVLVGAVAIIAGTFVEPFQINFMVGQAFAIAAASYFPLLFMAVWWRGLTMKGAATGMLAGGLLALTGISLTSFSDLKWIDLTEFWASYPLVRILCEQPAIWAVPLAITLMIIVSKLTRREVPADIRMKMLVLHAPEDLGLKQEYIQEHAGH